MKNSLLIVFMALVSSSVLSSGCSLVVDDDDGEDAGSTDSDTETQSDTVDEQDSDSNTGPEIETDSDTGDATDSEEDSAVDTDTEIDTETDTGTDIDTDTGVIVNCNDSLTKCLPSSKPVCKDYEIAACKNGGWQCVNPDDCDPYSANCTGDIQGQCWSDSNILVCPKFYEEPPNGVTFSCPTKFTHCCIPTNHCVTGFGGTCVGVGSPCSGKIVEDLPSCTGLTPRCCLPTN